MYACRIYDAQYNVLSPTVTIGPPPSPTFLSGNSNVTISEVRQLTTATIHKTSLVQIYIPRRDWPSDIEFVNKSSAINLDSSWRSMATEILHILTSKRCNTTQFELIMDPVRSQMLQTFTVGVYHPIGCLAIDSWGQVHVPSAKMIYEWRSRGE